MTQSNSEMLNLDDIGEFSWNFGNQFFIETKKGNYIWSDPDYKGGNNTIRKFEGDFYDWLVKAQIPYARSKGTHVIRKYCGEDVRIL